MMSAKLWDPATVSMFKMLIVVVLIVHSEQPSAILAEVGRTQENLEQVRMFGRSRRFKASWVSHQTPLWGSQCGKTRAQFTTWSTPSHKSSPSDDRVVLFCGYRHLGLAFMMNIMSGELNSGSCPAHSSSSCFVCSRLDITSWQMSARVRWWGWWPG